jgi:hypothetical protein
VTSSLVKTGIGGRVTVCEVSRIFVGAAGAHAVLLLLLLLL